MIALEHLVVFIESVFVCLP